MSLIYQTSATIAISGVIVLFTVIYPFCKYHLSVIEFYIASLLEGMGLTISMSILINKSNV